MSSEVLFILRNAQGKITTISTEPFNGCEVLRKDAPELVAFLDHAPTHAPFPSSDAEFVRVLDDLIDTLIAKNILRHTDFPPAAQQKINARKNMRNHLQNALQIFRQDDFLL